MGWYSNKQWKSLAPGRVCHQTDRACCPNYTVKYMAYLHDTGDTAYVADGAFCGTCGQSRSVEGMQVIVATR
jgi:hydrophobic W protein